MKYELGYQNAYKSTIRVILFNLNTMRKCWIYTEIKNSTSVYKVVLAGIDKLFNMSLSHPQSTK